MVFDAARHDIVLFGGESDVPPFVLGDTWTWDGNAWKQEHPAKSPSPRAGAAIAYDATRRQVVLFG